MSGEEQAAAAAAEEDDDLPPLLVPCRPEDIRSLPAVLLSGSPGALAEVLPRLLSARAGIVLVTPGFVPCLEPLVVSHVSHRVGLRGGHCLYLLVGDLSTLTYASAAERDARCAVIIAPEHGPGIGGFVEWLLSKERSDCGWHLVGHVAAVSQADAAAMGAGGMPPAELRPLLLLADCVTADADAEALAAVERCSRAVQPLVTAVAVPDALSPLLQCGSWASLPQPLPPLPPHSTATEAWSFVKWSGGLCEAAFARLIDRFVFSDSEEEEGDKVAVVRGSVGGQGVRSLQSYFDTEGDQFGPADGGWLLACGDAEAVGAFRSVAEDCLTAA
eukprot:TRINITY_DN6421_c0_g2_i1.p1 TRINITY_DN6421_c0_g2~~TRINITY_DN6421_c0_g2_i1.p1  ORF type:complete len:331 (+),score=99.58 TRINITY_DN6421_c0_g2_i1:56-1048(+)